MDRNRKGRCREGWALDRCGRGKEREVRAWWLGYLWKESEGGRGKVRHLSECWGAEKRACGST